MNPPIWSFYTMPVGDSYIVHNAPKRHRRKIHTYGEESGKCFSVRRVDRFRVKSPLMIRRLA